MQYRHLGKWGVKVSEVALGSWLTYGTSEAENATACIHCAYEQGINFFDTANVYAGGEAEEVVGQALSAFPRHSYVLSTKVHGARPKRPGTIAQAHHGAVPRFPAPPEHEESFPCQEAGLSVLQMALAWCLRQKNISSAIIGATRPEQIEANVAASGLTLTPELLARIDAALVGGKQ